MIFNEEAALKEIAAIRKLTDIDTVKQRMKNLVDNLDISASGTKTVLYSGLEKGKKITDYVNGDIRLLDNTDASKVLGSLEFKDLVKEAIGGLERGEPGNKYLFDAQGGAWDTISKDFVKNTTGEVDVYIGTSGSADRTFFKTEWEAIQKNGNITSINDIGRSSALYVFDSPTINSSFSSFQTHTSIKQRTLEALNSVDNTKLTINDVNNNHINQFLKNENGKYSSHIQNLNSDIKTITNNLPEVDKVNYKGIIRRLGPIGSAIGFMIAANEANEAYQNGDEQKAKDIMIQWAVDTAGSLAGEIAGAAIGGVVVAFISIGAIPATIAIIGLSIAGGIIGTDYATEFYNTNLKDLDGNGRIELFDKLVNYFTMSDEERSKQTTWTYDINSTGKVDPLVLDLNQDGIINTTKLQDSNVYFDLDDNGISENTAWIGKEDGVLVYDRNSDGKIDNINELFGNSTKDGFTELKELFDANTDNVINDKDTNFDKLQVWQDLNENGKTDENELKSLSELGITNKKYLNLSFC